MPVSKTMWLRGIQIDATKMKGNARDEFRDKTLEITKRWKEGFANLKAENDRLQVEAKGWLQKELADIDAMTKSQIAQGPPRD